MVARTDLPFMMHTIPHLVRMCNFPFVQRVLFVDTAPLTGDKIGRPGIGTLEELRACCDQLLNAGVVDRIVDIDYTDENRRRLYAKHLGMPYIRPTHNYKGYPIFGTLFSLEEVPGDYVIHFDSDMMLYQEPGYSWIEAAIEVFNAYPQVMSVRPLAGPPHEQGPQQERNFNQHPDGLFYQYKMFSSRAYIFDRKRFDQLLPVPVLWREYKTEWLNRLPTVAKTWLNYIRKQGMLGSWEIMVTRAIEHSELVRANLCSPQAWTLHPRDRSPQFLQALPSILERVEKGQYPSEQAGYYDIKTEYWL